MLERDKSNDNLKRGETIQKKKKKKEKEKKTNDNLIDSKVI